MRDTFLGGSCLITNKMDISCESRRQNAEAARFRNGSRIDFIDTGISEMSTATIALMMLFNLSN